MEFVGLISEEHLTLFFLYFTENWILKQYWIVTLLEELCRLKQMIVQQALGPLGLVRQCMQKRRLVQIAVRLTHILVDSVHCQKVTHSHAFVEWCFAFM